MVRDGVTRACANAPLVCQNTGARAAPRSRLRRESPVLKSICHVDSCRVFRVYAPNVKLALRVQRLGRSVTRRSTGSISNMFRAGARFCRRQIQPIKSFNWTASESRLYDGLWLLLTHYGGRRLKHLEDGHHENNKCYGLLCFFTTPGERNRKLESLAR